MNSQVYRFPQSVKHENWILLQGIKALNRSIPLWQLLSHLQREQSLYSKAFSNHRNPLLTFHIFVIQINAADRQEVFTWPKCVQFA